MPLPAWFIKQKGLQTTARYTDMQDAAHARAFTVVKVAQLSALAQIKKDIQTAVEQGHSWQEFKRHYSGPPLSPHHLKTVYQTNVQSAFMAGRHAAALEATQTHPYWLYLAEIDAYTRPNHAALHHKVFRHDDPVWNRIIPPNGYNCRCRFIALSDEGLEDWGLTVETGNPATMHADKGFNSAPYAAHTMDKLLYERAIEILGNTHARPFVQSVLRHPARQKGWEAFIDMALGGHTKPQNRAMAFGVLPTTDIALVQSKGVAIQNGLVFFEEKHFAGKKWIRHTQAGDALSITEFKTLPDLFSQADSMPGAITLWDSAENNLVYLFPDGQGRFYKMPVRFNHNQYGGLAIDDATTVFKIEPANVNAMLNQASIQRIR